MGRPGVLNLRTGTIGNPQLSLFNYYAEYVARKNVDDLLQNIIASSASIGLMDLNDPFAKGIANRKDKDPNGYIDVIAHGNSSEIQILHNGKLIRIDHRTVAKLILQRTNRPLKGVRLISCNTGSDPNGFAQKLADKLHVPVIAPTKYAWTFPSGKHFVAGSLDNGHSPNYHDMGEYKIFYPRRKRK